MKLLIASTTDVGGARVCLGNLCSLLKDDVEISYLSKDGLVDIGVPDSCLKEHEFSTVWAGKNGMAICDCIDELEEETIFYEDNFQEIWSNKYTVSALRYFRRKVTRNHVSWLPPVYTDALSGVIKNYICSFLTKDVVTNLKHFFSFSNVQEVSMYYDHDLLASVPKYGSYKKRECDITFSYRNDSHKISPPTMGKIGRVLSVFNFSCKSIVGVDNGGDLNFICDHGEYLNLLANKTRGYLHYQDQWVETFGLSLYEAIRLCEFIIYKPEIYCNRMISLLDDHLRSRIHVVRDLSELITVLSKISSEDRGEKRNDIDRLDFFNNKGYHLKRMINLFENLHY